MQLTIPNLSKLAQEATQRFNNYKPTHPDAIVLFRVGDFYEAYSEDAVAVSECTNLCLTRLQVGDGEALELVGFPAPALDSYLPKLVRAGYRLAIL